MAQSSIKEATVNKWIENNPELLYDHASGLIYCSKCEAHLRATRRSNVKRHLEGAVHKGTKKEHHTPLEFYFDLIEFLILCNIPWSQLSNNAFKSFFEKYMCCNCKNIKLPSESLLRKVYLDQLFKIRVQEMQSKIADKKLWLSVDETVDYLGRAVVNLLVRPLESSGCQRPYLLACKMIDTVNGTTISQFVQDSLKNMWGSSFESKVDNVRMLCTDSVAYMISAGRMLKSTFPKMLHFTCLAHALNLVAGQIRKENPTVDSLISNLKKVFLKSPKRIKIFKEICPHLSLPPAPVITRWGTWLHAAFYYAKHFHEIKSVLSVLNSQEAKSIENALHIFNNNDNIEDDLNRIYENFAIIPTALTALQKPDLSLMESFQIFDTVRLHLRWANCESLEDKMEKIMDRNPDLDTIRNVAENISSCNNDEEEEVLKFANLTSVDVERSFSMYKWILDVRRNSLKPENIEKLMVIYFNSHKIYSVISGANTSNLSGTLNESDKENDSDGQCE